MLYIMVVICEVYSLMQAFESLQLHFLLFVLVAMNIYMRKAPSSVRRKSTELWLWEALVYMYSYVWSAGVKGLK